MMRNYYGYRILSRFLLLLLLCITLSTNAGDISKPESIPGPALRAGATFSWMPSGTFFYDAARFKDSDIRANLEKIIISELKNKGYNFVDSAADAEFHIGYLLVLESALSEAEIEELYQQQPEFRSLQLDPEEFEHGTYMIKAVDPKTRRHFWRNTLKGFTNLNMTGEIRDRRLHAGVKEILNSFPMPSE